MNYVIKENQSVCQFWGPLSVFWADLRIHHRNNSVIRIALLESMHCYFLCGLNFINFGICCYNDFETPLSCERCTSHLQRMFKTSTSFIQFETQGFHVFLQWALINSFLSVRKVRKLSFLIYVQFCEEFVFVCGTVKSWI